MLLLSELKITERFYAKNPHDVTYMIKGSPDVQVYTAGGKAEAG